MSVQVTENVIVKGTAEEIFDLWSDFEIFPLVIKDIKEINKLDDTTSKWVVKGPLGKDYEWIAKITRYEADHRIAWKTLEGDIKTSGQVTFKDLPDHETEVSVTFQYVPPAGKIGETASKILANPREKIVKSLLDFKAYAENMPDRIRKDQNKP